MATAAMTNGQQLPNPVWDLPAQRSMTLTVGPGARWLRVCEGRVWLTAAPRGEAAPDDVWLEAGERIALPAGAEVVLEGWPSARFQLLVPPCTSRARRGLRERLSAWVSRRLHPLQPA